MNKIELKNKLSAKFDFDVWKEIVGNLFSKIELFNEEVQVDTSLIKRGGQIGNIRLDDGRSLAIFKFEVADNINISRNRKSLRDIAAKYIDQSLIHGALVLYYSDNQSDYRLTFVAKQTSFNEDGQLVKTETAPKRYTFLLGPNESCTTAANRLYELIECKRKNGSIYLADVTEAFSVERLNKEFFDGYKKQYQRFLDSLSDTKQHRDYVKKLLGRIVFLHFLQKKGWMGVPASNSDWTGGDKNYLAELINKHNGNDRLLSDVLELLFFKTLNEPRPGDLADPILGDNIKIPYLNGGLFDKDNIDKLDIDFPYDYFKNLLDFFSQYNFTIDENDPDDSEVGIDPEMLGHIFENLLEDNKDKGAFYTPKEIVQYMCRESVIQYLKTLEPNEQYAEAIEHLICDSKVDKVLQDKATAVQFTKWLSDVKICDPAIGSGAFPMGVLNVLYHSRQLLYGFTRVNSVFSPAEVKREIIQNNIYGVDIEQGAVDIARLRFWLSLVVDETEPQPLPNLDYKIMQGNSLLESFMDYDLSRILPVNKDGKISKRATKAASIDDVQRRIVFGEEQDSMAEIQRLMRLYYSPENHAQKEKLKKEIDAKVKEHIVICSGNTPAIIEAVEKIEDNNKPFFLWHLYFAEVFQDGGFDIIIANPPYGAKLSSEEKTLYKKLYSDVHMRTPETYCYFISLACKLALPRNGIITYIVPNNLLYQNENAKTRELLALNNRLARAINLGDNTFENADVPTCIFTATTGKTKDDYEISYSDYRTYNVRNIDWWGKVENLNTKLLRTVPALVIGLSNKDVNIMNTIRQNGVSIDSIAEEMASGISTGGDKIFKITPHQQIQYNIENNILRKVLVGGDIDKYNINYSNALLIYTTRMTNIDDSPNTKIYLHNFFDKLKSRSETKAGILPWFSLGRNRYEELFTEPKIIMRQTSDSIRCVYDENGYYTLNSILVFKKNSEQFSYKYIATVLNSKITDYLYKNLTQEEGRTFAEVKPANVRKLYIPKATAQEQQVLENLYDYICFLKDEYTPNIHEAVGNDFVGDYFQEIIDGCVYELFFREHMKEREIDIIRFAYDYIKPITGLTHEEQYKIIQNAFISIKMNNNQIRSRLMDFIAKSPDVLKPIIQH